MLTTVTSQVGTAPAAEVVSKWRSVLEVPPEPPSGVLMSTEDLLDELEALMAARLMEGGGEEVEEAATVSLRAVAGALKVRVTQMLGPVGRIVGCNVIRKIIT